MNNEEQEFIDSLMEPFEIDEIVLSGLLATPCKDGHRVQIVGWAEMPEKITPEADVPAERILVLRGIMPAESYRQFIRRECEKFRR